MVLISNQPIFNYQATAFLYQLQYNYNYHQYNNYLAIKYNVQYIITHDISVLIYNYYYASYNSVGILSYSISYHMHHKLLLTLNVFGLFVGKPYCCLVLLIGVSNCCTYQACTGVVCLSTCS